MVDGNDMKPRGSEFVVAQGRSLFQLVIGTGCRNKGRKEIEYESRITGYGS